MKRIMVAAMLIAASAAGAQVVTGNPPGNTLAPATGAVTTAPAAPPATPAGDMVPARTPAQLAAEKYRTEIVCKSELITGSLFAKRKTCLTRKQWDYVKDENERTARQLIHDNTSRPNGN